MGMGCGDELIVPVCIGWTSVFASEGTFLVILVNFWAGGVVPEAALREFVLLLAFFSLWLWVFSG